MPRDMKNEISKYTDPKKGYFSFMEKKKQFIETHMQHILRYYGLGNDTDWKVKCIFVTSSNSLVESMQTDLSHLTLSQFAKIMNEY